MNAQKIIDDIKFAQDSGEFQRLASMLRWVAAVNTEASVAEFVAAGLALGMNKATLRIQFWQSRRFDIENYGNTFTADGRLLHDATES